MNQTTLSFFITILAGLSTLLGIIPILIKFKDKDFIIASSLAFASGVMITVSIADLIPESIHLISETFVTVPTILFCFIFFSIGILLSMGIDKVIDAKTKKKSKLYKIGIIAMLAIIMHNIPEGIATFMASSTDKSLGITLAIAISLHNIPEGISIAVPIYYATGKKRKAILMTFLAALSEPLGAVIAYFFLSNYMTPFLMGALLSIIAGIMINIAIYELLPTIKSYKKKSHLYLSFILGVVFMLLSTFLI